VRRVYNSRNFQLPQTFQVLPSGSLEVRTSPKSMGFWAVGPVAPFLPPPTMKSTLDPFVASSPPRFQMWVKLFVYLCAYTVAASSNRLSRWDTVSAKFFSKISLRMSTFCSNPAWIYTPNTPPPILTYFFLINHYWWGSSLGAYRPNLTWDFSTDSFLMPFLAHVSSIFLFKAHVNWPTATNNYVKYLALQ